MIGQFLCAITGVWIPILGSVFSCWEEWIHSATNSKSRLSPSFVERRWEACEAEAHTALYGSLRGVTGLRESLPCPQFQTAGGRAGGSSNQEFKQMIRHPQPRTTDGAQACNDVQSGACRSLPFPCPQSTPLPPTHAPCACECICRVVSTMPNVDFSCGHAALQPSCVAPSCVVPCARMLKLSSGCTCGR